jgi:lipid A oxidase
VRYDLKGDWDLIGEYQGTYSLNDVRLEDGGHFSTNIVTNALNIGVTKDF